MMSERGWKIGELAKKTGLTVRMLHHYDRIGLFSPSQYTESGHRLYSHADLIKLQQIVSLKQLGFSLKEIKAIIQNPDYAPAALLQWQISRLDKQIHDMIQLRHLLQQLYDQYRTGEWVSGEQFMAVMRVMNMTRSPHFTAEQIENLRKRYFSLGNKQHKFTEVQQILTELRRHFSQGKTPDDLEVVALARRWKKEMEALALTDPKLIRSAEQYYKENPEEGLIYGLDRELYLFIKKALSRIFADPVSDSASQIQASASVRKSESNPRS